MFTDAYRIELAPLRARSLNFSTLRFALDQWRDALTAYRAFEDRESRAIFRALLIYRVSPRLSVVTRNRKLAHKLDAFMQSDIASEPYPNAPSVLGQPVKLWPAIYSGVACKVATIRYGLYWSVISDQYYFRRGSTYIGPEQGDVVLDCGACLGDTAIKMAAHVGPSGHVYSFDPMPTQVAIARDVAARNGMSQIIDTRCCGVSNVNRSATKEQDGFGPGRPLELTDATITIDDFCRDLPRVNYIKMDIEGSETDALTGAHETIARFRPKLAICLYHNPADLWSIPLEIKRRYPFYRLFLDHHSLHDEETVLYCAP